MNPSPSPRGSHDEHQDQDQPGPAPVTADRPGWLPDTSPRPRPDAPAGTSEPGDGPGPSGAPTPPGTDDDDRTPAEDRKLFAGKAATFRTIARTGLQAVGGLLNGVAGQGTAAFLADEDDLATIPPPIGRIIARRVHVDDDANLSEAADMFAAGIGLVAWLAKGVIEIAEARLAARRGKTVPGQVVKPEDGAGEAAGPS